MTEKLTVRIQVPTADTTDKQLEDEIGRLSREEYRLEKLLAKRMREKKRK